MNELNTVESCETFSPTASHPITTPIFKYHWLKDINPNVVAILDFINQNTTQLNLTTKEKYTFLEFLDLMNSYRCLQEVLTDPQLLKYWIFDLSIIKKFDIEKIQKIINETKQKFFFCWILQKPGLLKTTNAWLPILAYIDFEKVVQLMCFEKIAFNEATKGTLYLEGVKTLVLKFAPSPQEAFFFLKWRLFKTIEILSLSENLLFESVPPKKETFFKWTHWVLENKYGGVIDHSINQDVDYIDANVLSFNALFDLKTIHKHDPIYFANITDLQLLQFSTNILKLVDKTANVFDIIKLVLNYHQWNVSMNKMIQTSFETTLKYFDPKNSDPNLANAAKRYFEDYMSFEEFFKLASAHNFKECNICSNMRKTVTETSTRVSIAFKEHIIDIYESINKVGAFNPKKIDYKKFNFYFLNDRITLKRAALELHNCMASFYSSLLKQDDPKSVLFVASPFPTIENPHTKLHLGLKYSLNFENKWVLNEIRRAYNHVPSENEKKIANEIAEILNKEHWRPQKEKK